MLTEVIRATPAPCYQNHTMKTQYILSLDTTVKSLCPSSLFTPFTLMRSASESFLPAEQSQLSQLFLIRQMLQTLNHLHDHSLDLLRYVHISLLLQT